MKLSPHCLYLLAALGLAGCGQPGPLYLPDNPPPGLKVDADPDQPAPIPERNIDQAPPPIDAKPAQPAEAKPKKDQSPTENTQ